MFEARDKGVKVHAVNMKSKQVQKLFMRPEEVERKSLSSKDGLQRLEARDGRRYSRSQEIEGRSALVGSPSVTDLEQAPPAVRRTRTARAAPALSNPSGRPKSRQLKHFRANSGDGLQAGPLFARSAAQNALKLRINDSPKVRELRLKEEDKIRRIVGLNNLNDGFVGARKSPRRGPACCSPTSAQKSGNAGCNPDCSIF